MRWARGEWERSDSCRMATRLGLLGIIAALAGCAASDGASLATGSLARVLRISPARMSNAQADALIARAITEHERRRP